MTLTASLPEASAAELDEVPPPAPARRRKTSTPQEARPAPRAALTSSWGVIRRLQVPGRGRVAVLCLVVEDVPRATKAADVQALLEANGYGAEFAEGGIAWANYILRPEGRWPEPLEESASLLRNLSNRYRFSWQALVDKGLTERRITINVEPVLWARLTLAAAAAGVPMSQYIVQILEVATE